MAPGRWKVLLQRRWRELLKGSMALDATEGDSVEKVEVLCLLRRKMKKNGEVLFD